jgi:hypothetical protein
MSKKDKLFKRLLLLPNNFTWEELTNLLAYFGFEELKKSKTGGSRRKFGDDQDRVINLHKPHPGNVMKRYTLRQVIEQLKDTGVIKNE